MSLIFQFKICFVFNNLKGLDCAHLRTACGFQVASSALTYTTQISESILRGLANVSAEVEGTETVASTSCICFYSVLQWTFSYHIESLVGFYRMNPGQNWGLVV